MLVCLQHTLFTWLGYEPRSVALRIRPNSDCFSFSISTRSGPFFKWVVFLTLPAIYTTVKDCLHVEWTDSKFIPLLYSWLFRKWDSHLLTVTVNVGEDSLVVLSLLYFSPTSGVLWAGGVQISHFENVPLQNSSCCYWGKRGRKNISQFSCPASMGPPPWANLRKHFKQVTFPNITIC